MIDEMNGPLQRIALGACVLVHRVYGPGLIIEQRRLEGLGFIDAPGSRIFLTRSSRSWVG
jgi:hypothetical protein